MLQTGSRFIFRHLKGLNYCSYNIFLYSFTFKQDILQHELYCKYKNQGRSNNINVQKYFGTFSARPRKIPISNIEDLKKYIGEEKQFYLKLLVNILDNIRFDNIPSEDAKLLLACCGRSVADSSKQIRNDMCQDIYKRLLNYNKLNLDICHVYIEICTDNSVIINCKEFLSQLKFEPNQKTYKQLLDNVCERGDIGQALELLEMMKIRSISANEEMFNKLVLARTIYGGAQSGEAVVRTMRTAQIPETSATRFSILKGVLQRNNADDVDRVLEKYSMDFAENQLLELLETLGLSGNISWLTKIKHLYSTINVTRDYINALRKICIHLVHMDKSEGAMAIFKEFVEPEKEQNYGFFILKEMLHCNVDIERIIGLCTDLHNRNLNEYAFEQLTEIALRHNYIEASWKLLENMSILRPHFFWPLLIDAQKKQGEIGIFSVLKKMINMNVKTDAETLQFYVLPFCNVYDVKLLIKKLQILKVTTKEAVNSLLVVLLQNEKVKQAADLCSTYDINIFEDKLFRLICSSWVISKDRNSVVLLLQRYCESNPTEDNLVGDFLIEALDNCKSNDDFLEYIKLLELIHERKLRINTAAADVLNTSSSTKCKNLETSEKVKDAVNMLLDLGLTPKEPVHIPLPRNMTVTELECHLLELQEKNMETRGVLRKLIQLHANAGHSERVDELRKLFLDARYGETVGMQSSLMHNYIKSGDLEQALSVYNQIKIANPNFKVDDFKVIDLTTLLVKEERYCEAMDILKIESISKKVLGGPAIERNCWKLLNSFKNADEQLNMFKVLVQNGYCKPSNIIFGPLLRIHLNRGDLQKCVNIYVNCANEYKCTPLQLEIMKAILKVQDERLLENVVEATKKLHGFKPTQVVLIAALAENGQKGALQKLFMKNKVVIKDELERRCDRWVQEGKLEALQTLASVCEKFPREVFDVNFIYYCIMRIHSLNNDYKSAVKFYEQLLEKDIVIDKELVMQLKKLGNYNQTL